jgi:hypothetical protein
MSTTSEAHCYSRWHYPWPQRCHGQFHASFRRFHASFRQSPPTGKVKNSISNQERAENKSKPAFILPDLTVIDWGIVDYYGMPVERIRAVAFLRASSNVP